MSEVWKDIEGYDGQYQISDTGRVKSFRRNREKILRPLLNISHGNYKCKSVVLFKNSNKKQLRISRLVAETFIRPLLLKEQVDHIDRNSLNNSLDNLRIVTNGENRSNCKKQKGTSRYKGVHWSKKAKKWEGYARRDKKAHWFGYFDSEEEAALAYNNFVLQNEDHICTLNKVEHR